MPTAKIERLSKARMSDQGIDAGVSGDVDEVLVDFAPNNTERPASGRVHDSSEWDTYADKDEVGQCQTQHDRVGRRAQAVITGNSCHDRQVPDEPEDSDDTEDDRYNVTEQPPAPSLTVRTDVSRVRLVSTGRVGRPVDRSVVVVRIDVVNVDGFCWCRYRLHDASKCTDSKPFYS